MVRKTKRKNGGMFRTITKIGQPVGRVALTLGKEYGKDYGQKKLPDVTQGIYNDPSLASDPNFILTGRKKAQSNKIIFSQENDSENINPNIIRGGKTKRYKKRNKKIIKTRRKKN